MACSCAPFFGLTLGESLRNAVRAPTTSFVALPAYWSSRTLLTCSAGCLVFALRAATTHLTLMRCLQYAVPESAKLQHSRRIWLLLLQVTALRSDWQQLLLQESLLALIATLPAHLR